MDYIDTFSISLNNDPTIIKALKIINLKKSAYCIVFTKLYYNEIAFIYKKYKCIYNLINCELQVYKLPVYEINDNNCNKFISNVENIITCIKII